MSNSTPTENEALLHWSFDHNDSRQPNFGEQLIATLRTYRTNASPPAGTGGTTVTTYRVLPNYSNGVGRRPDEASPVELGSLVAKRAPRPDGSADYHVTYANTVSGERLVASFTTASDRWRSLTGSWQLEVTNSAGDAYRRLSVTGSLQQDGDAAGGSVRLIANGISLPGIHWRGTPLTAPWVLLDILPELDGTAELALLEDLERLREPVRVVPIGDWQWPQPRADLGSLGGWCAHGPGLLPTYYWIDGTGVVAIVSGLFQTWIVTERRWEETG